MKVYKQKLNRIYILHYDNIFIQNINIFNRIIKNREDIYICWHICLKILITASQSILKYVIKRNIISNIFTYFMRRKENVRNGIECREIV